jgi:chaperone required for assembly of F1-ATPase
MKRFWKVAEATEHDSGFGVALDGRPVKTPSKQPLVVPTRALAEELAAEWAAQEEVVNPEVMPFTRLANSALDKVTVQHGEVAAMIAEYGGSDLLCYRAEAPEMLIARQAEAWDPLLDWAREAHGIALNVQTGLMPVPQPYDSLRRMHEITAAMPPFELTAFHELVTLPGSWIIAMAALSEWASAEILWDAAHVDETWQAEQWGDDEEALAARAVKKEAFLTALRFAKTLA